MGVVEEREAQLMPVHHSLPPSALAGPFLVEVGEEGHVMREPWLGGIWQEQGGSCQVGVGAAVGAGVALLSAAALALLVELRVGAVGVAVVQPPSCPLEILLQMQQALLCLAQPR